jgi:RHS repeat-associated protein
MSPFLRIVAVLAFLPASLGAIAQTLAPSGDAHVRGGSAANNNYGGVVLLGVKTANQALQTYWSYLKFDTSGVSGQVISARLRLLTALSSNGSVQTNLHAAPATWGETTITWNNKPALGAQLGSFTVANTGYVWFELDVTAHVQAELAQGAVGFALVNPAVSSQLVAVQSRESSNPAQLVLTLNAAPTVSLSAPAPGTVFTAGGNVGVLADAADADGTVSQVEFFANGASIGLDTTAPYGIEWANVAAGSYSLTARATDNLGAQTTSAAVPITVNAPPTVSLISPAQNATFTAPANITLAADTADADGTVTSVEFYQGTTLITTLGTAPYTFTWTNVPQGPYVLTARATDDRGAVTTSAPVNIAVGAAVGQLYFIHADHLNTPRLVADATGTTVWRWDQAEPFGNNPADEDPDANSVAFDLPLRLPGQRYDAETALHYNYFRDYDPSIGRYGESDPFGLLGGLNTYSYVQASPLGYIDPLGLQAIGGAAGTAEGVGGALGGGGRACCSKPTNRGETGVREIDEALGTGRSRSFWPSWMQSESDAQDPSKIIPQAPVPPYPGLKDLAECKPGTTMVEPAVNKRWRGGVSIQQEYFCPCGQITRHTIILNGVIMHDHFRPGPPKPGGGDGPTD